LVIEISVTAYSGRADGSLLSSLLFSFFVLMMGKKKLTAVNVEAKLRKRWDGD
jgi:hypothetical protein